GASSDRRWPRRSQSRKAAPWRVAPNRTPPDRSAYPLLLLSFWRLLVAAKLLAHRRQDFFCKGVVLARAKPCVKRSRQDLGRHRLFNRRLDRPPPLPRIFDVAEKFAEIDIFRQRDRSQVQEPRRDDAAAPP